MEKFSGLLNEARSAREINMASKEESGSLAGIRFHENGYLIGWLEGDITIVGNMPYPKVGMEYHLKGYWTKHHVYGPQFKFESYSVQLPASIEAIRLYLQENAKWVGPVISREIISLYGKECLQVCKDDPERVSRDVKGITPKRADELSAMLKANEASEQAMIDLKTLLAGSDINNRAIGRMVNLWGDDAAKNIRENPYRMIDEIHGVGFKSADKVAINNGYDLKSEKRVRAAIIHVLKDSASGSGHTCLPMDNLSGGVERLARIEFKLVRDNARVMVDAGLLKMDEDQRLCLPKFFNCENAISRHLLRLLSATPRHGFVDLHVEGLMEDQERAMTELARSPVFILTGAPGTGKTFTIDRILKSFGGHAVLAAPTGKAAKRMYEQSGRPASTIHRLLEPKMGNDGKFFFTKDEKDPVEASLIIIDESSMIDVSLMESMLRAVESGTRVLFVGDTYQLPPVGPGNVLKDMIGSGVVPFCELTIIKRQDPGLIIRNCHRIKAGKDIVLKNESGDRDLFFVPRESPAEIVREVYGLVSQRLPDAYGYDPFKDIQVISPLRDKTILSCKDLNQVLQKRLNPSKPIKGCEFKVGDKVIQTKNEYSTGIINGDIGYVLDIDRRSRCITVEFENPHREVDLDLWINNLMLAYSITCHKYQGSEAPAIIIPVHRVLGVMVPQRNWIYTAISRAVKTCILVGQRKAITDMIGRNRQQQRHTRLLKLLAQ